MPCHSRLNVRNSCEASYRPASPIAFTMDPDSLHQRPSLPYATEPESYFGGVPSRDVRVNKIYSQTYMYICCQCQDGPKVFNVQPQCVNCGHTACSCCAYVK